MGNVEVLKNDLPNFYTKPKNYKQLKSTWDRINVLSDKSQAKREELVKRFRGDIHQKLKKGGVYIHNEAELADFVTTYAGKGTELNRLKASLSKYVNERKISGWAYKYEGVLSMNASGELTLKHGTAAVPTDTDIVLNLSSPMSWKNNAEEIREEGRKEIEDKYRNGKNKIHNLTREQIMLIQKQLNVTQDGVIGKKTISAIKDFQRANDLEVDGIIGKQTFAKLQKKAGNISSVA